MTDLISPASSSCSSSVVNGQVTFFNRSNTYLNIQVVLRGFFVRSNTSGEPGSNYVSLTTPAKVLDTRSGTSWKDTSGNVFTGSLQPFQSITVPELGVAGIPLTGVSAVADQIDAVNPTATGWLTESLSASNTYAAPLVNFSGGDNADNTFDNTFVAAAVSSSGTIVISNYSSGTVDVVVSARGYWNAASAPGLPTMVQSTYDSTSQIATLNWQPPDSDGNSPILGYVLYKNGIAVANVSYSATSANVAALPTDQLSVGASNDFGAGTAVGVATQAGTADPALDILNVDASSLLSSASLVSKQQSTDAALPSIWSGTVVDSSGVGQSAQVTAYAVPLEAKSDGSAVIPIPLAVQNTDANGAFSLAAAPTNALRTVQSPDGTFDVMLQVAVGNVSSTFDEPMQILTNPGSLNARMVVPDGTSSISNCGCTANDLSARWVVSNDVPNSTSGFFGSDGQPISSGSPLVIPGVNQPANTAPTGTDTSNLPLIGAIPALALQSHATSSASASQNQTCGPWGIMKSSQWTPVSVAQLFERAGANWAWSLNQSDASVSVNSTSVGFSGTTPLFSINQGSSETLTNTVTSGFVAGPYQPPAAGDKAKIAALDDAHGQFLVSLAVDLHAQFFSGKCYSGSQSSQILTCAQTEANNYNYNLASGGAFYGLETVPNSFLAVWYSNNFSDCFAGHTWNWGVFQNWSKDSKTGTVKYANPHPVFGSSLPAAADKAIAPNYCPGGWGAGYLIQLYSFASGSVSSESSLQLSVGPNLSITKAVSDVIDVGGTVGVQASIGNSSSNSNTNSKSQTWTNQQLSSGSTAFLCPTIGRDAFTTNRNTSVQSLANGVSKGDGGWVANPY